MVEPGTGLTILGTAVGSAKLIEKILGPTAEYLGGGLRDWTEKQVHNVGRIFDRAGSRLGKKLDQEGSVAPKVVKHILQEGAYADDDVSSEYFAGVLASSRSGSPRDDRGAAFAALVARLTTYQLRAHYLLYRAVRTVFLGETANPGVTSDRKRLTTFLPIAAFYEMMEFDETEDPNVILSHSFFGLYRETLLEDYFHFGPADYLKKIFPNVTEAGVVFAPTALGVELYLWAHGRGDTHATRFLDPTLTLDSEIRVPSVPGQPKRVY